MNELSIAWLYIFFIVVAVLPSIITGDVLPKIEIKERSSTNFKSRVEKLTKFHQKNSGQQQNSAAASELLNTFRFKNTIDPSFARRSEHLAEAEAEAHAAEAGDRLLLASVGDLGVYNAAGKGIKGYSGDGGSAKAALVGSVTGIAVDTTITGDTYIADGDYHVVRVISGSTGDIATYAGTSLNQYDNDDQAATLCSMNSPQNLAVDYNGDLYIADMYNNRIRKVTYATGIMSTVAGSASGTCTNTDWNPPTTMCLSFPIGVAVDALLNIYISEGGANIIRYVDVTSNVMYTLAGTGAVGYSADGLLAGASTFSSPAGLYLDASNNLFIADYGNSVIRKHYANGGTVFTVAGSRSLGAGFNSDGLDATNTQINQPYGVTVDNDGNIFISDTGNNRIRVVDALTNEVSTYAGSGSTAYNGDHIAATAANLKDPNGIALDASSRVVFCEASHYVVRYLDVVSPTSQPTGQPTGLPSGQPSMMPSSQPTAGPTNEPTGQPSEAPSNQPSSRPSSQPSLTPTIRPTGQPSRLPTNQPSSSPTRQPSCQPSSDPSSQPSSQPSGVPSGQPSAQPVVRPTSQPSEQPTGQPTSQPSRQPTGLPTGQPSCMPTSSPTLHKEDWGQDVRDYIKRSRKNGLCHRNCSGHGICMENINCDCFKGLAGEPLYTGPDCSLRTCPTSIAWIGAVMNANDMHPVAECSNRGICDRSKGECQCFAGYGGIACQRSDCPMQCHGRGICLPERILADRAGRVYLTPWDSSKSSGCFCDAGYRGPACEHKECPTGPDPLGGLGADAGRDCSGRGICDMRSGKCHCFKGFVGTKCETLVTFMH